MLQKVFFVTLLILSPSLCIAAPMLTLVCFDTEKSCLYKVRVLSAQAKSEKEALGCKSENDLLKPPSPKNPTPNKKKPNDTKTNQ